MYAEHKAEHILTLVVHFFSPKTLTTF